MFEINDISMIYDMDTEEKMYALDGFNLKLPDTGLVGVIGPSGSGKSTLMYCMSTLKSPTEGSIIYNDRELTTLSNKDRENLRRNEFGFIFQKHYLVPYMNAMDNVAVAGIGNVKDIKEKAAEYLKTLGLKEREFKKKPAKLSGGQCQRVAIARAMINDPKVIFADEPTGNLDPATGEAILDVLFSLSSKLPQIAGEEKAPPALLIVTHTQQIAEKCDRILTLEKGILK